MKPLETAFHNGIDTGKIGFNIVINPRIPVGQGCVLLSCRVYRMVDKMLNFVEVSELKNLVLNRVKCVSLTQLIYNTLQLLLPYRIYLLK